MPWYRTILFKMACLIIAIIIPSMILYINLYTTFQNELSERLENTVYVGESQIMEQFDTQISEIEKYIWQLYQTDKISYLSNTWDYHTEDERIQKISDIQDELSVYKVLESFIYDISVYLPQRGICIRTNTWGNMNGEDWEAVNKYEDNPETFIVDGSGIQFYLGDLDRGRQTRQISTICRVTISPQRFQKLLNSFCTEESIRAIILIDGNLYMQNINDEKKLNTLMEKMENANEEEKAFELKYENERYFCTKVNASERRIEAYIFQNYDEVLSQTQESFMLLPMLFGINLLVFGIAFLYVRKYVKNPVQTLREAFQQVEKGTENVKIEHRSRDEFDILYAGFNEMNGRLTAYVKDNYLTQLALQREQLKQLQAQINPHFLYNTLLLIKIRVRRKDLKGAEEMTDLLSNYFRSINRNKRDVIALEEELECINTYMQIQVQRFTNRLRFILDECPETMKKIMVPRLILQPLVENAIKYGMEQSENTNVIRISFRVFSAKAQVIVEQSGTEYEEDQIQSMNQYIEGESEEGEITSTININRRLHLFYGDGYKLQYYRTQVHGLQAVIDLAYENAWEEEGHEKVDGLNSR